MADGAGETCRLEVREERSINTHNHFFAMLNEGWNNLPEDEAGHFPTPDHLRKWLLIKTGYRDERTIPLHSRAEALRVATFIKPMDEFAVVTVHEAMVIVHTAKSRSVRAMGKAKLQKSKSDVLDELAAKIAVARSALEVNAGKAA